MKIENKTTSIVKEKKEDVTTYLTYGDLINLVCQYVAPNTAAPIAEQRIRFRIMDEVEKSNGEIEINEKWIDTLSTLTENFPFGITHRDLVEFSDAIEKLKIK